PLCLLDEETTKIRSLLGLTPDRRDRPQSPRILQEIDSANVFESQLIAYEAKIDKLAGSIAEDEATVDLLNCEYTEMIQVNNQHKSSAIVCEHKAIIKEYTSKAETSEMDHEREKNHLKEQYELTADDLRKAEKALKDTTEKYERAREAAEVFEVNEEVLKTALAEFNEQLELQTQKTKLLKEAYEEKIENFFFLG
ncbi:hypothetical protein QYM36_006084, partial [Artemia franciscana]